DNALNEINTLVNAVLNQLPKNSQQPVISISIGQTIDAMYIGFYSDVLPSNKITDYLLRVVQPKLQAVNGVQQAQILGGRQFALRAWLDPMKLAAYHMTATDVANALANNDFISAVGRTDGDTFILNLTADTGLTTVDQFRKLVLRSENGAIIRLGDVGEVSLGSQNYNSSVSFDGKPSVYIGIQLTPSANLLTVINDIRKVFPEIQKQLPEGLSAKIVYDSSDFVDSSIDEVVKSLLEALVIVTVVIFLFLGSVRSVSIPVIAIPLSLVGTFFMMLALNYSINLLTLLALVLAIGLVVDDAIIVVENVQRHIEEGKNPFDAALIGARELANPIIAITVVLIAVYAPIGFMGGLTGALFTEFAFTLAGSVTISAIIALTLSPMMCSKFLKPMEGAKHKFMDYIDNRFARLENAYERTLHAALDHLPAIAIFAVIILINIYFLYATSRSELAPQEDQGIIISQLTSAPNAPLAQTQIYSQAVNKVYFSFPETDHTFTVDGSTGLNNSIIGMVLKPWDERKRTSNELQPMVQQLLNNISGAKIAAFQLPSLPGSSGLPVQFVIDTTESFDQLNELSQALMDKARASGMFLYIDSDLKIDKAQTTIQLDRDKAAVLGLTMQDVGNSLQAALSENYINYFNFSGRSYQVIPQTQRTERINYNQLLNYYITVNGISIPLSTIATLKNKVVPESLNHFQQLNSTTISAVPFPGVTMGQALGSMKAWADELLPQGYTIDYAGASRQFIQEGSSLVITFIFALIIIFLSLAALFESFRDPLIVMISVPMSICGALIFISLGVGGATLNIYSQVGLVTLIGLISKHGILIVQFANDLQLEGKKKREAIQMAAGIRLRPILMTTAAMVLGVIPLIFASGAGAVSRFNIGLVIATGISIGTLFTLFVVPAMYMFLAEEKEAIQ
ncbi:MAG TPA: efflux RND transporter permease subunit, partial [Coxiellaceae bacterium]|nr:efflux RND transporter permease subunit [Coxiellaceae bacterium]